MQRAFRKTISVVFSDVVGSTALAERLDPESLHRAMTRYFAVAKRVHQRHGGVVEKFIGDAVVAIYGVPSAHEDDALRAVRAADELRGAMAELNRELQTELKVTLPLRTGVNTGLVLAGNEPQGQGVVSGDILNVAARLQQAAAPEEVLLGETTYQLVADAVRVQPIGLALLRGRRAPVDAYRLLEVSPIAPGLSRRENTPLVGRTDELAFLHRVLDRAVSRRACELVSVLGDPGVGKSRLLQGFAEQTGRRALLLQARCPPNGQAPHARVLAELLGQAAMRTASTAVNRPVDMSELAAGQLSAYAAVRQLLQELALTRPVVIVIDDLHWAEPVLLDFIEYLHAFSRRVALLLVVAARRHPLDHVQALGGVDTTLVIEPLPAAEATKLALQLHGPGLSFCTAARIAAWAEGNPLFIEEALRRGRAGPNHVGAQASSGIEQLSLPPAVEALLGTELDGLPPQERLVLELASVLGRVFDWASVAALAPAQIRSGVGAVLLALARRGLIRVADRSSSDDAFSFRHGLLRDVTYQAIPKQHRAALHMRVAERLAELANKSTFGDDEAVRHLEQAYHYLAQLAGEERLSETIPSNQPTGSLAAG
jgi:class 3 adenylate cyclase